MRVFDRDLIRGEHYGQRSCEPHSKAEHMAQSDAPPQDGRASLSAQSGNGAIITPMRRFPPPCTIEEHAERFTVKDETQDARVFLFLKMSRTAVSATERLIDEAWRAWLW